MPQTPEERREKVRQYARAARARKLAAMTPEKRAVSLAIAAGRAAALIDGMDPNERRRARRRRGNMKPEDVAKLRVYQAVQLRRLRDRSNPENAERIAKQAAYHVAWMKRRRREEKRRFKPERRADRGQLVGSVLAASAPSPWQTILAEITAMVPISWWDADEIVAEAALRAVEGMPPADAVVAARKAVFKSAREFSHMTQIEMIPWL